MKLQLILSLPLLLVGCQYIEQPTPRGPSTPIPYRAGGSAGNTTVSAPLHSEDRPSGAASEIVHRSAASGEMLPVSPPASFAPAYRAAGKPRITLFFNRHISDPVDEWKNTEKSQTAYQHNLENQMNRMFISGKARIVDRETMIHLFATDSGKTTKHLTDLLERKKLEISSLRKYTDLFIEVHIKKDPTAPAGYLFRAVAKEIQTGQIIADTLCNSFGAGKPYVAAGDSGYEVKQTLPDLDNAAVILASHLLEDLASAWE